MSRRLLGLLQIDMLFTGDFGVFSESDSTQYISTNNSQNG